MRMYPLFLGSLGFGEMFLIFLAIMLLFGGRKIPELMHGLGKGLKSFRAGMKDVEDELKEVKKDIKELEKDE